jgi:hypothetical protein
MPRSLDKRKKNRKTFFSTKKNVFQGKNVKMLS